MAMLVALLVAAAPVGESQAARPTEASFNASVTIVRDVAEIGHGRKAPPWAHPRWRRVDDSSGAARDALIYEFE